jgi:4-amino-4-deoxy-L-arabinose transferase-like glycosyltransferase
MNRPIEVLVPLIVAAAAAVLYARQLDVSPPVLHPDEIAVVRQANAITLTGHDLEGRRLPLFFRVHDNVWTAPLPVYFTALLAWVGLLPAWGARFPSVLIAAINVALTYVLAVRLFGGRGLALLAAALLALTPAHFIHGRLALASVYPVSFVLLWLLALTAYMERRQTAWLCASTLSLGIGFYSHSSSVLLMPVLVALTLVVVLKVRGSMATHAAALAGFVAPLLVAIPWFYVHRDVFPFTVGDWGLRVLVNPREGLAYSILSWPALATRASVYWGFFSPSYLFFSGGAGLVSSTQQAGVFLGLMAVPLLYGLVDIVRRRWTDPQWRVVALAFVLSPLAAATFTDSKAAGRAVAMLPFGVLIAVTGVDALLGTRQRALRAAAIVVLLLLPVEFYRFYDDYFAEYPERAHAAFLPGVAPE